MKKIVIFNSHWCSGGVEALRVSILENLKDEELSFTILATQKETDIFDQRLKNINVPLKTVLNKTYNNPIIRTYKNTKALKKALKELNPDIIHINASNAVGFKYAKIAKKACNSITIVHSHNASIVNDKLKLKLKMHNHWKNKYYKFADYKFACSDLAAKFVFKDINNVYYLKNGVDASKFDYNLSFRKEIRDEFNIKDDEILLGHIGRFSEQKNHKFLINIFNELNKKSPNKYKLMLVGEGETKEEIINLINEYKLNDRIIDAKVRNDTYKLYQAFDIFLLPSLHEGLPVVGVEAQASGLKCLFANTITKEAKIVDSLIYLPIDDVNIWVNEIINSNIERTSTKEIIKSKGFDIKEEANKLKDFYKSL